MIVVDDLVCYSRMLSCKAIAAVLTMLALLKDLIVLNLAKAQHLKAAIDTRDVIKLAEDITAGVFEEDCVIFSR